MSASASSITVDASKIDELDAAICDLARKLNAETYRMLELVRDFDDRFGFAKWGYKTCAEWLHWRCQMSLSAAREKVRTAHALRRLPKLSAEFASGHISYTKVRALTRVATVRDEDLLLAYARRATAAEVEERVRQMRNVAPESADMARRAWERRSLTVMRNTGRGTFLISAEVPAEAGEIVVRALERAVASGDVAVGVDHVAAYGEDRSATDGWRAQQADALVAMSKAYLAHTGRGASIDVDASADGEAAQAGAVKVATAEVDAAEFDAAQADVPEAAQAGAAHGEATKSANTAGSKRSLDTQPPWPSGTSVADHYQVIVHVDEKSLRGGAGRADLPLPTMQRLTCDGSLIALVEDDEGNPLAIGRKQRTLSTTLRRLIWARDKHCTFPGCARKLYADAHHLEHWAHGGETDPDNLTLVCSYHHVLLHEGGFSVRKLDDGALEFLRPDGRVIPRSGYRLEDMVDDFDEVREARAVYRINGARAAPTFHASG